VGNGVALLLSAPPAEITSAQLFNCGCEWLVAAGMPVSLCPDPFDISLVKGLARKKGVPHTQLMAIWPHERIGQEKEVVSK
jgi:hypothetical protein